VENGQFTSRQLQVLREICKGDSAQAIAARLGISPRTVEYHKSSMIRRTGLDNMIQLIVYAVRQDLLD
jgi:DNA-binding NarL/FixJ family response regulator